jgi:HK97 family phage major capsid protein
MNLHTLRESRAAKVETLKALAAKAEAERRDLSADESTAFDAGRAEVEKLDRDIRNAEFLAEAERRAEAEPVSGSHRDLADLERRFRVGKAIAEMSEHGRMTGAEGEYAAEHRSGRPGAIAMPVGVFLGERRAVTTGGSGGNLVATELGPMIDRLRPSLAVEAMGATVLSGLTSNLDLPRLTGSGSAGWVAEHGGATRSDATFDKVSMGPKTVAAEYELSRRMMIQATQIETILRADIGFLLAQALDGAAIKGGGANEPVGILGTAGVPVVAIGANGGALALDVTADMIGAIDAADVNGARGFLTNAKVRKAAMKLKDGQNRPYGVPAVFHNEPVTFSNQVPGNLAKGTGTNLSALIYGAWADLVIGYWSTVDIVVNPYHADVASKGGALLHAFLDADIALRHGESFVVSKDVVA